MAPRSSRSDKLLQLLADYQEILLIVHDNPDPDAIASGWALQSLIQQKLGKHASLVGGGAVVRAENLKMLELLQPPIVLVDSLTLDSESAAVLIDCSPTASNHLLEGKNVKPVGVIDHHVISGKRVRLPFRDIRPSVAAAATIVCSYFWEQDLVPSSELATALVYAIRTETKGSENPFSRLDVKALSWLSPFADHNKLTEIENAPLTREYFSDLLLAIENTFIYDGIGICFLPTASGPETIGEVADLLIRCEQLEALVCVGLVPPNILISSRTRQGGGNATELLSAALKGLGYCGGHEHRAGGKIILDNPERTKISDELQSEIRARWLSVTGREDMRGTRLVAKKDILENL